MRLDSATVRGLNWRVEGDGSLLDPDYLRPAFDNNTGIVYGIRPDGSAVVVKEYESYRTRCARDFALMVWPDRKRWQLRDDRFVSCLGSACCGQMTEDISSAWRITDMSDGQIRARLTTFDKNREVPDELYEEHLIYTSNPDDIPTDLYSHDLMLRAITIFDRPYDPDFRINPAYLNLYDSDPAADQFFPDANVSKVTRALNLTDPGIMPEGTDQPTARGWNTVLNPRVIG